MTYEEAEQNIGKTIVHQVSMCSARIFNATKFDSGNDSPEFFVFAEFSDGGLYRIIPDLWDLVDKEAENWSSYGF